jgi:hypothetical protein
MTDTQCEQPLCQSPADYEIEAFNPDGAFSTYICRECLGGRDVEEWAAEWGRGIGEARVTALTIGSENENTN